MQSKYGGKVEVVAVADIGTDDLTEAVKGMFCRRLDQDLSLYPDIFFYRQESMQLFMLLPDYL